MTDKIEVSFRVPRQLNQQINRLIERGIFASKSELFRQALRDLLQKFEVISKDSSFLGDKQH